MGAAFVANANLVFGDNYLIPRLTGEMRSLLPLVVVLGLAELGFAWGAVRKELSVPVLLDIREPLARSEPTSRLGGILSKLATAENQPPAGTEDALGAA